MTKLIPGGLCMAAILAMLPRTSGNEEQQSEKKADRLLRHVVLFKFKESATKEQIAGVERAFAKLPEKIDVIVDFEYGTDISAENLSKGFTHCFLVTFRDKEGRDRYLPHRAHREFVKLVKPILDDVLVVDYQVQK